LWQEAALKGICLISAPIARRKLNIEFHGLLPSPADAQIESFIAGQKDMAPIIAKTPQGDRPDPKVMEQLEAVAKKFNFASYDEYDDVAENIGLIMSGI
jgi:hypothetical protein